MPATACAFCLILRSQLRAPANSRLRMPSPTGITTNAGPGRTIIKTPTTSTDPPTMPTAIRLATLYVPNRGCLSSNTNRDLMTVAGGILRETPHAPARFPGCRSGTEENPVDRIVSLVAVGVVQHVEVIEEFGGVGRWDVD